MDVRILGAGDTAILEKVADSVFDNAVNLRLSAEFLSDPRHHLCAAIDDGVVVGFGSSRRALYRAAGGEETTGVVMTTFSVRAPS